MSSRGIIVCGFFLVSVIYLLIPLFKKKQTNSADCNKCLIQIELSHDSFKSLPLDSVFFSGVAFIFLGSAPHASDLVQLQTNGNHKQHFSVHPAATFAASVFFTNAWSILIAGENLSEKNIFSLMEVSWSLAN